MNIFLRFKVLFLVIFFVLASISVVNAGTEDNVYGWAWSENFGWMSFNCINTFTCGTTGYGVNVDRATGEFEGYAWSPNVGWISFAENNYPAVGFSGCVDNSTCDDRNSNGCSLCYNYSPGNNGLYGWAKILSFGDEGWIKFDHGQLGYEVTASPDTGFFSGWAWNGNTTDADAEAETGVGWISFNCEDTEAGCSVPGYRVVGDFVNNFPEVANLTAPNWSFAEACSAYGALQTFLEWDFIDRDAGACEKAYQIIVSENTSTSTPILDTGKCEGTYSGGECYGGADTGACQSTVTANRFNLKNALASASSTETLQYNKAYYWWVKVWDDRDLESDWYQFDASITESGDDHVLTDNQSGNLSDLTFTTFKHKMPNPSFSWWPLYPNIGENVAFTDTSKIYATGNPDTPQDCNVGQCDYYWTFEQAVPLTSTDADPSEIKFKQGGSMNVTIKVTDGDGYYCHNSANVENVSVCLPLWQEKRP